MPEARLEFTENGLCRAYFAKFSWLMELVRDIAGKEAPGSTGGTLGELETEIVENYLKLLASSFEALSIKYLLTGLVHNKLPANLEIDQTDSGFPVFREMLALGEDGKEAQAKLLDLPDQATLKGDMIDHVLKYKTMPRDLQFAMSQRIYHEMLLERPLFYARNDLRLVPVGGAPDDQQRFFAYWATYDSQRNLPNIYFMVLDSSMEQSLEVDHAERRRVAAHLYAQSLSSLKLITIATGFDKDFPRLHPKLLKRIHVGPMYANHFTRHGDIIQTLLEDTGGEDGQDWVFCWTVESLFSKESKKVRAGLFGETLEQVYHLDAHSPEAFEAGASTMNRSMILPYRPYQHLVDGDYPSLVPIRKFVVGPEGLLLQNG